MGRDPSCTAAISDALRVNEGLQTLLLARTTSLLTLFKCMAENILPRKAIRLSLDKDTYKGS